MVTACSFPICRIHAEFFIHVLTRLGDLTIMFILGLELLFGSTVVIMAVITPMVITAAILAVWLKVILATI